jgi:hypothetical protein
MSLTPLFYQSVTLKHFRLQGDIFREYNEYIFTAGSKKLTGTYFVDLAVVLEKDGEDQLDR